MALADLSPTDTRYLFRPVSSALVALLRGLQTEHWQQPTLAGTWVVRDVVSHLLDVTLRRLSFHRDRMAPPSPARPINSERDFVNFINSLNAQWIDSTKRLSSRVLTDLFEGASTDLADWFEAIPFDAPALFAVSWAGEQTSQGWFDIGREFTELWHHQEQIRIAVGAPSLTDPQYLQAVIEIAVRGLPYAYRDVPGSVGDALVVDVIGPAGGTWTLVRASERWRIQAGEPEIATTRIRLADETAWKLLFNALRATDEMAAFHVSGREELARPLLKARSVIV